MANIAWHVKLRLSLDLAREDLGHPEHPDLWTTLYEADRLYASRGVPVSQRDLQCGGVCREAGVEAWMYLRLRANGRREAVHEHREDEERHSTPMSDEHKAYQERILKAAESGGFLGDNEVRTQVGRSWIQTDTMIEGADGRRIGWEVQLSSAAAEGPRSVRARAAKAQKNGITPAWHTDRLDYARRQDTQWTASNNLPAEVIAKNGDLRVISGVRELEFWRCDLHALYPCPYAVRRCGKVHVRPQPRQVLFDELVRRTAAGLIVPVEVKLPRPQRFWVTDKDEQRLLDHLADQTLLPPPRPEDYDGPHKASPNRPTCRTEMPSARPAAAVITTHLPAPDLDLSQNPAIPAQRNPESSGPRVEGVDPLEQLIALQADSDRQQGILAKLEDHTERARQREKWAAAAAVVQAAITQYAKTKNLNRYEVERVVRHHARTRA